MAEVLVAAEAGQETQARGLADALRSLGYDVGPGAPADAELAKLVDDAKCVIVLWSGLAPPAWLAVLATMALDRRKLISAETRAGAVPALFHAAPRFDLSARDRTAFQARFGALVAELDKLAAAKANPAALPNALAKARAAMLWRPRRAGDRQWTTLAAFAAAVAVLFAVGFGAGRVITAARSGALFASTSAAQAATTAAPAQPAPPFGVTVADLERQPWRISAAHIDAAAAQRIKAAAERGDALAQAVACLGHMAGAEGFMPSPTAARAQCDAAAAQHNPAGLYFSWALRRAAPHAGIDETTARSRLAEAARLGWTAALIDYGAALAADASREAQIEAGRLWLAAAERGDPRGQFYYARWLRDSAAGPRDPTAALPFLERAAAADQPDALHMLATFYRDGVGAPRDEARARELYDRAARQNHAPSMFNLADMLRAGAPPQRARAVELYRALACMPDERQIQPMAVQRLHALQETYACR